jgi:hypothetical protein
MPSPKNIAVLNRLLVIPGLLPGTSLALPTQAASQAPIIGDTPSVRPFSMNIYYYPVQ